MSVAAVIVVIGVLSGILGIAHSGLISLVHPTLAAPWYESRLVWILTAN